MASASAKMPRRWCSGATRIDGRGTCFVPKVLECIFGKLAFGDLAFDNFPIMVGQVRTLHTGEQGAMTMTQVRRAQVSEE